MTAGGSVEPLYDPGHFAHPLICLKGVDDRTGVELGVFAWLPATRRVCLRDAALRRRRKAGREAPRARVDRNGLARGFSGRGKADGRLEQSCRVCLRRLKNPCRWPLGVRPLLSWWPAALLFAGAVSAQVVPGGFGLLIWAGTLAVLSYVLAARR
jgi:hypothetical protein